MCMWYVCVLGSVCACGSQKLTLGTFLNCFLSYILRQSLPLNLELMSGSIWDLPVSGHAPRTGVMAHGIYTGIGDPSSSLPFKQQALQPLSPLPSHQSTFILFYFCCQSNKSRALQNFHSYLFNFCSSGNSEFTWKSDFNNLQKVVFICMDLRVAPYMWMLMSIDPGSVGFPEVTNICDLPDTAAGNSAWILCKISMQL